MTHEGGGAKPSKKSKIDPTHFELAEKELAAATAELQNAREVGGLPPTVYAELHLKAAHVHAMLAVAVASGQSGLTQTIVGGWRSPHPPAFDDAPQFIPEWAPEKP